MKSRFGHQHRSERRGRQVPRERFALGRLRGSQRFSSCPNLRDERGDLDRDEVSGLVAWPPVLVSLGKDAEVPAIRPLVPGKRQRRRVDAEPRQRERLRVRDDQLRLLARRHRGDTSQHEATGRLRLSVLVELESEVREALELLGVDGRSILPPRPHAATRRCDQAEALAGPADGRASAGARDVGGVRGAPSSCQRRSACALLGESTIFHVP
jgi:hypothetical protein